MNFQYKLNQNLLGRNAAQLVAEINQLHSGVSIYRKEVTTCINAKSLVGILSGYYKIGDTITIYVDDVEDVSRVKEILNEYGTELKS